MNSGQNQVPNLPGSDWYVAEEESLKVEEAAEQLQSTQALKQEGIYNRVTMRELAGKTLRSQRIETILQN